MTRYVPLTPDGEYYAPRILSVIKDEVEVDPEVNDEDILWRLQPQLITREVIRSAITELMGEQTAAARRWVGSGRPEQDLTIDEIVFQMETRYKIVIDGSNYIY
tara:strand:- start:19 stop:330 length:312 start_codon:yes stop_codon:yes gene_type:complete